VLVTEWKQFAGLDLPNVAQRMAREILVDARNLFDPEEARPRRRRPVWGFAADRPDDISRFICKEFQSS